MSTCLSSRTGRLRIALIVLALATLGRSRATCATCFGFGAGAVYGVGIEPLSVALGDVNGDGKLDLAVANAGYGGVTLRLGNGDGTFSAPFSWGLSMSGVGTYSVVIGDVTGNLQPSPTVDGKPDLVFANFDSDFVLVLPGNGNGTFGDGVRYYVGTNPYAVAIGDVNGDRKPDIAVANFGSGTVSILLGNGRGTFDTAVNYFTGANPASVAIADVNGDGKPDLAVANSGSSSVSVLLGNGDGTFARQVTYRVGVTPVSLALGDIDGDGKLDLAVANFSSATVSVLLGNGEGTFRDAVDLDSGSRPSSIALGDINGDGKLDLAVTRHVSNTVSILLGNGNGTFEGPVDYGVGSDPSALVLGDLNGDGKPDLAVANALSNNVSILLNTCDASDSTTTPDPTTGANHPPIALAGHDQTVSTNGAQAVAVTLNGAASSDPDGDPLTFVWVDAGGHLVGSTAVVSVSLSPGTYSYALTVSDGRGGTGSDSVSVIVVVDTDPPIVTPPQDITVGITTGAGARGSDDDALAGFLTGSHASDRVDPTPTFLGAQVNGVTVDSSFEFPTGATSVTFRWRDYSGNIGRAMGTVTVLDHLKKGDLLVGESFPVGYSSVGRVERIRNGVAAPFCETNWDSSDPTFWDLPGDLIVDSKGRVVFLASLNGGWRLLRCTHPGEPAELLANFSRSAVDAPPSATSPFPRYAFTRAGALHLAKRTLLTVNNDQNGGWPKIADDETYNVQATFYELNTTGRQVKTFVYHVATGQWDADGPAGISYLTSDDIGHMFFNGGTTYAADGHIIRAVVNPLQIDAGLKIGNVFSGKLSLMLGGAAKQYDNLTLDDVNIPNVGVPDICKDGGVMPLVGGFFATLDNMYGVVKDTWGSFGLVVTSGNGNAAPFLTNISEDMFEPNGGPPAFVNPYQGCLPTAEVMFSAPLKFSSPTTGHGNSVNRMASTSVGLVGTNYWDDRIVRVPTDGADELETVASGLPHPMGIAGFPEKISPGYGVVIGISIQSPVNILMTDAQGRRIGMDLQSGAPVNDFGDDGVDSGPGTEPRYFFVKDPAPGPYSVQTVGTGDGPYTVDVYSADTTTGLGGRLTHTGTAAPGSIASHDFALGADVRLAFTSPSTNRAPTANAGADQTVEATSSAGATVHLDGSASSDPDGDTLVYTWTGPFGVLNGAVINPLLPVGAHVLTLAVDDGHGGSAKAMVIVTVNASANSAPSANAGPDQIVEATSPAGATVVLDGSASTDPDHDALTFTWSGVFGVASGMTASVAMPFGMQVVTLAVDDGHGHTATAVSHVTVQDTRPPSVTCGSADGVWHNADVAVACVVTDGGSGLANPANAAFSLSTSVAPGTEVAGAPTGSRTVCDAAGNCATSGPIGGNKVDKKAPAITIASPSGSYVVGQSAAAGYTCADGGSGIATCRGSMPNGSSVDVATVGTKTFKVDAADVVANTATRSVTYDVGYGVCLIFDRDDHGHDDEDDDDDGASVRLQICSASGANLSSRNIVVTATRLANAATNATEPLESASEGNRGPAFRFEPALGGRGSGGGYVFKVRRTRLVAGTYTLYFSVLGDPTPHHVDIQVKRKDNKR